MSIIDKTLPYEVLIRFGEDGLVKGGHYQDRRIVEIDGERVMDLPGAAKALADSPEEVRALLPGAALTAFAEIDRLNGLIATHDREVEALRGQLGEVTDEARISTATVARLVPEMESAHITIEQGNHKLAKLENDLRDAQSQITGLTSRLEERDGSLADMTSELAEAKETARSAGVEIEQLAVKLAAREATLKVREADIIRIEVQLEEARQALGEAGVTITDPAQPLEEEPV